MSGGELFHPPSYDSFIHLSLVRDSFDVLSKEYQVFKLIFLAPIYRYYIRKSSSCMAHLYLLKGVHRARS